MTTLQPAQPYQETIFNNVDEETAENSFEASIRTETTAYG